MIFVAEMDRMGCVHLFFKNRRIAEQVRKHVVKNGGPNEISAFIQNGEEFLENCTPAQRKDLEEGWEINFRADAWDMAHYWGYDAHTVFERKETQQQ